jgi:hypothetical protein
MSNMTLFNGAGNLPAHLQTGEIDEVTKKLLGKGGGGLRISIKGGVWRMLNNGEEVMRNEERALHVVVVNAAAENQRTYYADTYTEGEVKPPTCWSTNGVYPEAEVKTKMAASCAQCQKNVAGSGSNGSRACKYSRNLALTLENDPNGQVFKINLPAQSIFGKVENGVMPLDAYVKLLASQRVPITAVVTEMKFDTSSATPKIGFKALRYLSAEEYAEAKLKGETPEAIEACKTTVFAADYGSNDAAAAPAPAPKPTTPTLSEADALRTEMARLQAQLAATQAAKEPVKMEMKEPAKAPPSNTAQLLQAWDNE